MGDPIALLEGLGWVVAAPVFVLGVTLCLGVETMLSRRFKTQIRGFDFALSGGTGLLVAVAIIALNSAPLTAVCTAIAATSLLSAARTDWRFGHIADVHSALIAMTALLAAPSLMNQNDYVSTLLGGLLALIILGGASLISLLRGRTVGLGMGDVLLAAAAALWCGVNFVGPALFIAAITTITMALVFKRDLRKPLAFAPGLSFGFALATLIGLSF